MAARKEDRLGWRIDDTGGMRKVYWTLRAAGRGKKIVKEKMAVLSQSNFDGTAESIERIAGLYILMCLIWQEREREILHNKDLLCKEPQPQRIYYPLFSIHTHTDTTQTHHSTPIYRLRDEECRAEILSPLCTVWYYPSLQPEMTSYYSRVALFPQTTRTRPRRTWKWMGGQGRAESSRHWCVCVCARLFFLGGGGEDGGDDGPLGWEKGHRM
jgi:hypothetical protein